MLKSDAQLLTSHMVLTEVNKRLKQPVKRDVLGFLKGLTDTQSIRDHSERQFNACSFGLIMTNRSLIAGMAEDDGISKSTSGSVSPGAI